LNTTWTKAGRRRPANFAPNGQSSDQQDHGRKYLKSWAKLRQIASTGPVGCFIKEKTDELPQRQLRNKNALDRGFVLRLIFLPAMGRVFFLAHLLRLEEMERKGEPDVKAFTAQPASDGVLK
jgi:hypothetical protein